METVCSVSQAAMVTGAAILAGRALVKGILEEYGEIIAYWKTELKGERHGQHCGD